MLTLNLRGRLLDLHTPLVMGIVNATPDSFFSGSRAGDEQLLLKKVGTMISEGVDIIDIGGQSTRPGADALTHQQEAQRVLPAVEAVLRAFPEALISIDTFFAPVAAGALDRGASMVNDISGGLLDAAMLQTVARYKVPYVCMHMRGTPQTMHQHTSYTDLITELLDYFIERIEACRAAGIVDIIIDPGFGFSKTVDQNFFLLRNLSALKILARPMLAGLSRKSTIYRTLGITAEEALNGTTVLNTVALMNGASILRVHDVREAKEAVKLVQLASGGR
jgi:dihydropteroate synthase